MATNSNELLNLARKLSRQGMTEHLKNGKEAVSVSLMLPGKITEKSRQVRKEILKNEFSKTLDDLISNHNLEIDLNSVSPSAQTIQAKLGIESIQPVLTKLNETQIEIYPNTKDFLTE